jgi:hypothetical protein
MAEKISNILSSGSFFERIFFCPGCNSAHGFRTKDWPQPNELSEEKKELFKGKWTWNNDINKPTIYPSIHVFKIIGKNKRGHSVRETICHSFIENGNIRFLNDCKHVLKGKTVELPDF